MVDGGQTGEAREALLLLQSAHRTLPNDAAIALRLADALHAAGRLEEAEAAYEVALRLNRTPADGWYGLGCAQLALKSYAAAARSLQRAAALAPDAGAPHYNLARALFELGSIEAAVFHFGRATSLDPSLGGAARASIACIIPGNPEAGHAAVLCARRSWIKGETPNPLPLRPRPGANNRKLRIGYLSAFFGAANWMKPVFGLINRHDREAFDIYMLSDGEPPCAAAGYSDHDSDRIYDLRGVPNHLAAAIIADASLDVLVDLNGYSFQSRLPMLLHRPAANIIGWFNMFATTGLPTMDWLVGDASVIHPEEEQFYAERIHRVPGSYLAFEILYPVPEVAPPPCLAAGGAITFGCLGSHYKLTDGVLAAWARILHAAPGAALFIKNGTLQDQSTRDDLLGRLHALGIVPGRVTLDGRSGHAEFLAAYRHVDIALDTFPYNGGTTTTEALWQGVPVIAFDGDRWAARTSKSLLLAADLSDWVKPDVDRYIEYAAALANDPATPSRLAKLRAGMRDTLRRSPVCDADGLCFAMEQFYRQIIQA